MTLREAGLPLGIREPYKGSGIVTLSLQSVSGEAGIANKKERKNEA